MSTFKAGFQAGRSAVKNKLTKNKLTSLLMVSCISIGVICAIEEVAAHHYILAVLGILFFIGIIPWLGFDYVKRQNH